MGFALPAAIAAALCVPARLVVAFTGDGGLGMTLAEIETAARLRLRIAVVVFNDGALSLIKIKQRPAGQGGAEAVDFGPVSYARAAQALGARPWRSAPRRNWPPRFPLRLAGTVLRSSTSRWTRRAIPRSWT